MSEVVTMPHALSVDVEDWHNAAELLITGRVSPPTDAVVTYTRRMFDLLSEYNVKATWFFLGEVAEAYPELVRLVADAGHEIGVHGYHHHRVFQLSPDEHFSSLQRAKQVVEDAAGKEALGYRAVAMSIGEGTWHALDAAARAGFTYDSSLFPFRGPVYGVPDAAVEPHWRKTTSSRWIFEVPLTVLELGPFRFPGCGGGYLRHFPLGYTRALFKLLNHQRRSAVVYLHPYEFETDSGGGSVPAGMTLLQRLRFMRLRHFQYRNRGQSEEKLRAILGQYHFGSIEDVFAIRQRRSPGDTF